MEAYNWSSYEIFTDDYETNQKYRENDEKVMSAQEQRRRW